ncbi:MAG: rRNA maturation RNase YbeY [Actinomycetota bacterium]|nr:rRNA maturation RNase YbeY [Actinomycetota bacterium]
MSIEVANESGSAVDEASLVRLARHVLDHMGVSPLAELSLLIVDEDEMARLHQKWMGEPGPTDVMAFPMDELDLRGSRGVSHGQYRGGPDEDEDTGPTVLGDIVLCPTVAAAQALAAGHSSEDELHLLCTHGVLHLLGYDHGEPAEYEEMFGLQGRLLASWRETGAAREG